MTVTVSSGLYKPEVWQTMLAAKFKGKAALLPFAAVNDTLVGQPGDVINAPSWNSLSGFKDLTETERLVPQKMSQKNSKITVKRAGMAVEFTDTADITGFGEIQDEAIDQIGILVARHIDSDLIASATATIAGDVENLDGSPSADSKPLIHNAGSTVGIGYKPVNTALGAFGDDAELEDFVGMVVHSSERTALFNDDNFIAAGQGNGANEVLNKRVVGLLAGLPVIVSDRITPGQSIVLKKNAIGLFYKKRPVIKQDEDILGDTTVVAAYVHYGTKRIKDDGVLVINWNTADA